MAYINCTDLNFNGRLYAAKKSVENYGMVRDNYLYNTYQKSKTFKQKFCDFIDKVLNALIWGK